MIRQPLFQLVIAGAVLGGAVFGALWVTPLTRADVTPVPVSAANLREALTRTGLTPSALATAGVSPDSADRIVRQMRDTLAQRQRDLNAALRRAQLAAAAARQEEDRVRRGLVRSNAQATSAGAELTASQAACNTLLSELRSAACRGLPDARRSAIERIATCEASDLPPPYLVVARSAAEWDRLRQAIRHRDTMVRLGRTVHPRFEAILAVADSDPSVVTARRSLEANATALAAAWERAIARHAD